MVTEIVYALGDFWVFSQSLRSNQKIPYVFLDIWISIATGMD
jgi:hypothetical protein